MGMIDRKVEIAQRVQQQGRVSVAELAQAYGVSTMTIRRDLARLEQEGLVTVEYGGAILKQRSWLEMDMHQKQEEFREEKRRIAEAALALIRDGDSVFVDAGTSACEAARLLKGKKNLNIMTNSLLAANALAGSDNKLLMCPGEYRGLSMAFLGPIANAFLQSFRFDVLLLGVEGITDGIYVPDETDGLTKRCLMQQADNVICLADSSKFGKRFHYRVAGLEEINHLITDDRLDKQEAQAIQKKTDLILV